MFTSGTSVMQWSKVSVLTSNNRWKLLDDKYMRLSQTLFGSGAYHNQRSHKIEGLADGVFAIVMTLLVLDIRIPLKEINTENGVWLSLLRTLPKILTFILSFSVVGQFWSVFTNQFNYVHTSDRNENIIAMCFLMSVSLLPFSTTFLSEHLWSRVAMAFYTFNILLILLWHTLHWSYSYHNGLVKLEGNERIVIHKAIMNRVRTAFIAYVIVAGCCFYSSYLALCGTILVHIIFTFTGFIEMIYSLLWKKAKGINHNFPLMTSKLPSEPVIEFNDIIEPPVNLTK
jgi:uncharacterized membrane protein